MVLFWKILLFAMLFVAFERSASVEAYNNKREVPPDEIILSSDIMTGDVKVCQNHNPCAWAIYSLLSNTIDSYMENTCVCAKDKRCLRTYDDVSIAAYVYRCRVKVDSKEAASRVVYQQPKGNTTTPPIQPPPTQN